LNSIDAAIVVLYFAAMLGLGFWYQRMAAKNLESYFLGGKQIHWLALAMSGSVSNFDITGTMWIVALLKLLGMKSMWNHWMWGFLMGAFFLAFMGKWIRRSGVMTGAEWMVTRFGDGRDGKAARGAYALMAVVTMVGFVGYAFQGIGKFSAIYVDMNSTVCAIGIFTVTTTYVMLGGLYSVVITDVIQTIILTLAAIVIMGVAYTHVTTETIATLLPADWTSLVPPWRLDASQTARLAGTGYEVYEMFGALLIVWIIKGFMLNLGGPAQMYDFQRFLAARNPRDAAKVGAAWSVFLVVRWGMAMGIALLAIVGINEVSDPEQVMPAVLQNYLPVGIRGVVIAGLLAAFMSTFSSTVNSGASYIIRDLWQPFMRPNASDQHLIRASYVATIGIVATGTLIGLNASSIREVFDWIMGALGAAFVVPNVLRWFWWRLNGMGYAIGTVAGLVVSFIVWQVPALAPMYIAFPLVSIVSLVATFAGTLLTKPTDEETLEAFFRNIHPFGFWGPIRAMVAPTLDSSQLRGEGVGLAVVNTLLGLVAIMGAYLAPMYLVSHNHVEAVVYTSLAIVAMVALKFTWYDNLPAPEPVSENLPRK
jgi:SSS family solute:Na+ symporter